MKKASGEWDERWKYGIILEAKDRKRKKKAAKMKRTTQRLTVKFR